MIDIRQVVNYVKLSEEGLVPEIKCPMDQGLLYANIDDTDTVFLYCLACEYKKIIGVSLYSQMLKEVENGQTKI